MRLDYSMYPLKISKHVDENLYMVSVDKWSTPCIQVSSVHDEPENYWNDAFVDKNYRKVFIEIKATFYHFLVETLATAIRYINSPEFEHGDCIVLYLGEDAAFNYDEASLRYLIQFFQDYLTREGLRSIVLSTDAIRATVSNLQVLELLPPSTQTIILLREFFQKEFRKQVKSEKHKPIYLSREGTSDSSHLGVIELQKISKDPSIVFPPGFPRLVEELEFSDHIYETLQVESVVPERNYKSLEDQIMFFSTVNVLISTTSSALMNMLFMPKGSTVIELKTPLVFATDDGAFQETHYQYSEIAYLCGHSYISLGNKNRSSSEMIKTFDELYWLQKAIRP